MLGLIPIRFSPLIRLLLHMLVWPWALLNLPAPPDAGGDSGGQTIGGGGTPGTPTGGGGAAVTGVLPNNENGGVLGTSWLLFVPVQNVATGLCFIGIFDLASFDDTVDGSSYSYRKEDVVFDQVPTVNRVILTYRDLGRAKVTVTVSGSNDDGQVISTSVQVQIGNAVPTGELLTKFVDLQLTGFRPQLTLSRKPGDGPLCITAVTMMGEVDEETP